MAGSGACYCCPKEELLYSQNPHFNMFSQALVNQLACVNHYWVTTCLLIIDPFNHSIICMHEVGEYSAQNIGENRTQNVKVQKPLTAWI